MLPAKGYLKSINCPFFETCICERPYCHYKHNKKDTLNRNTDLISEIVSKAVHKVLQENGASKNVTYNPTPISQLNKYKNDNNINNNNYINISNNNNNNSNPQINKKHIPIQYTPEQPRSIRKIEATATIITTTTTTAAAAPTTATTTANVSVNYVPSLINEKKTIPEKNPIDVVPNYSDEFIDEFLNDPNIYEDNNNNNTNSNNNINENNDYNDKNEETSDSDDETTLEQCRRIFDEYKVPPSPVTSEQSTPRTNRPPGSVTKKRVAYENPQNVKKETIIKAPLKNPALAMMDRYKNPLKRCPDSCNECPIKSKRIASVPNVSALLDAKKSIDQMIEKSKSTMPSAIGPTMLKDKSIKRTAHVPEIYLTDVPTVRQADKSKLPVNIRSKYLYLIVKECLHLYISRQAAYERALNEEFKCYSKCSAINSYKNTIMLLINRLRKEVNGTPNAFTSSKPNKQSKLDFDDVKLYEYFNRWILNEEQLIENGFPRLGALKKGHALFKSNKILEKIPTNCQQCARCKKMFQVNDTGYPAFQEDCIYHPYNRILIKGEAKYSCCQQISLRKGCCISNTHVFEITNPETLTGFVSTFDPDPEGIDPRSRKIYALDCEMVYTTRGLELARVTVIDNKCNVCYESLVKPLGDILDCNTRFSGLTIDVLQNVKTKITDVQATLLLMFNSKTILVGHSFESDLKALRLIHNCVIDTSVLFPHKMGPQKKRALRTLASDFLKKIIQNDEGGHDSAEDAITCMELLIWKLKEELKTK